MRATPGCCCDCASDCAGCEGLWCCCCRHMAYLKSQHRASMSDETMVSNIGAKDFPDPTDNPERPLEKLEIDPEVALGHELSYGY